MTFVIISHVPHIIEQNQYFAYAPYVREMNIWIRHADKVLIVAPITDLKKSAIDINYEHENIEFVKVDGFDVVSLKSVLRTVFIIPEVSWFIFDSMAKADHIHLRCPGNIGLLGCFIQMLFPSKSKTAKYAGNWDPKSNQPWSYKLQKWVLSNTFLSRNMQVLVYGQWEGRSKNIRPFFAATYKEGDKTSIVPKDLNRKINFIFVGTLVGGKNPLYAIQLVENLAKKGYDVMLHLYGEGLLRARLKQYITENQLDSVIKLEGIQNSETIKKAYQNSCFVILPSKSEGWPKAIAEGMFWGCVPLATAVSCVPFMLGYENRGVLLELELDKDLQQIELLLNNQSVFAHKSTGASSWSRKYTVDFFEQEIEKLLL